MFEKKIREIVEELKNTNEFNVLKKAKDTLDRNSQLKGRVDQFVLDQAEICRWPDGGGKLHKEELERKFDEMMRVPEIAAYVKAGQKFVYKNQERVPPALFLHVNLIYFRFSHQYFRININYIRKLWKEIQNVLLQQFTIPTVRHNMLTGIREYWLWLANLCTL